VLYIDVAKVDRNVTHVIIAINVCFKCMFQMNATSVYLDVVKVDLHVVSTCMLQAYVRSVFRCFIRMLASVSFGCYICLQWFSNVFQAFSQVF
jgi:hypothetical protein